ncbi:MAG: hypothetical protein E6371_13180 [Terrisporobacter othiniensis]|uniref:hypothetical protein n=1 Tax=Terrisporobacter othiniensis TaxID=1577792 RepID=UPI00290EDAB8|nr:hypothetical protein [Terrisporobacter othiniensis]MDU6985360.1 hypothetical protein [Terrisporobacter othiniensis]
MEFFNEVNLLYAYSNLSIDLIKKYEDIEINKVKEKTISNHKLSVFLNLIISLIYKFIQSKEEEKV